LKRLDRSSPPRNAQPASGGPDDREAPSTLERQQLLAALLAIDNVAIVVQHSAEPVPGYLARGERVERQDDQDAILAWCITHNAMNVFQHALTDFKPAHLRIDGCCYDNLVGQAVTAARESGVGGLTLSGFRSLEPGDESDEEDTAAEATDAVTQALATLQALALSDCDRFSTEQLQSMFDACAQSGTLQVLHLSALPAFNDACLPSLAGALLGRSIKTLNLAELELTDGAALAQAVTMSAVTSLALVNCQAEGVLSLLNSLCALDEDHPMPLIELTVRGATHLAGTPTARISERTLALVEAVARLGEKYVGRLTVHFELEAGVVKGQPEGGQPAPGLPQGPAPEIRRLRWEVVQSPAFVDLLVQAMKALARHDDDRGATMAGLRVYFRAAPHQATMSIMRCVADGGMGALLTMRGVHKEGLQAWDAAYEILHVQMAPALPQPPVENRLPDNPVLELKAALADGRDKDAAALLDRLEATGAAIPEDQLQDLLDLVLGRNEDLVVRLVSFLH
jgi:hypothetical protein